MGMLTLIAPDIHYARRPQWLKDHFAKANYDLVLAESRDSLKDVRLGGYKGETEIYSEHDQGKFPPHLKTALISKNVGFISDGGAPTVGDPGHELARTAHEEGVAVTCSGVHSYILAALIVSGCSGNRFQFLGYPPRDPQERKKFLRESFRRDPQTPAVLMDTPYRTLALIEDLIALMDKHSWLSVSANIGGEHEMTFAGDAGYWKRKRAEILEKLGKKPLAVTVYCQKSLVF